MVNPIVPGDDVHFNEVAGSADTLDAALTGQDSSASMGKSLVDESRMMSLLGEKVISLFQWTKGDPLAWFRKKRHSFGWEKSLIPYLIRLRNPAEGMVEIYLCEGNTRVLIKLLEDEFGENIKNLGIYEVTGLMNTDDINCKKLVQFFPDLDHVIQLSKRYMPMVDNPYQTILSLPLEARPFFTSLFDSMKVNTSPKRCWELKKPELTIRDVIAYAELVGELPKVGRYMSAYLGRKLK